MGYKFMEWSMIPIPANRWPYDEVPYVRKFMAWFNVFLLVWCTLLAVGRMSGMNGPSFQAVAHITLGLIVGIGIGKLTANVVIYGWRYGWKEVRIYSALAVFLTVVECIAFFIL